jgi:hypothetical protein
MMPVEVLRSDRTGRRGLFRSDWLMPFGQRTYGQSLYFLLKKKIYKMARCLCSLLLDYFPIFPHVSLHPEVKIFSYRDWTQEGRSCASSTRD